MIDNKDNPLDIFQKIPGFIEKQLTYALTLVLQAEGSTPRKPGTRAIIDGTGKIIGTLGGGVVEGQAQKHTIESCKLKKPVIIDLQLQCTQRKDDIPICGGSMRILIDPTVFQNKAVFIQIAEAIKRRQKGVILTTIKISDEINTSYQWFLQDSIPSDIQFPAKDTIISCLQKEQPKLLFDDSRQPTAQEQVFIEPVVPQPHLVIAGAGHVGRALAIQAELVGFDITVIDDRPEFAHPDFFPKQTTIRCGDIVTQLADIPIDKDTYIVIVTRGHQYDADVLEACIHKQAAYIGMIASRKKAALIRKNFIESALATKEQFDRVFTPIGLDIGAVTVPEIAASITAELIAVRRMGVTHKPWTEMENR
jgi:xanthine dehydrogenase accessory factor